MSRVSYPLMSVSAVGSICDALNFQLVSGVHFARWRSRKALQRSARQPTASQLSRRAQFRNAVAAWNAMDAQARASYDAEALRLLILPYNAYMRMMLSLPPSVATTSWDSGMTEYDLGVTIWQDA